MKIPPATFFMAPFSPIKDSVQTAVHSLQTTANKISQLRDQLQKIWSRLIDAIRLRAANCACLGMLKHFSKVISQIFISKKENKTYPSAQNQLEDTSVIQPSINKVESHELQKYISLESYLVTLLRISSTSFLLSVIGKQFGKPLPFEPSQTGNTSPLLQTRLGTSFVGLYGTHSYALRSETKPLFSKTN